MGIKTDAKCPPERDVLYISSGEYNVEKSDSDDKAALKISMADKENMITVECGSPKVNVKVDDKTGVNMTTMSSLKKGDPFRITFRTIDEEIENKIVVEGSGNGEDVRSGYNEKGEFILENAEDVTISSDDGSLENVNGITINKKFAELNEGSSEILKATLNPESNVKVTWKSSDASVAKVDEKGTVTGMGPGRAEITASVKDYASGKEYSDSCSVVVRSKTYLAVKQKTDVKPLFSDSCTKFVIKNKAEKKTAKLDKKGFLKGKKAGTVTVTGQDSSGTDLEEIIFTVEEPKFTEKSKKFSLEEAGDGVTFDPLTLMAGGTAIQPDKWESSKTAVAEVDEKTGIVTFKGVKGSTKITVYYGEGKNASKLILKLKITK